MAKHWLDTAEYPFTSNFFYINGHRLHYIDEGEGDIILFVHGTPSWSFDFRNVIKILRKGYRCIAIDHLGFGLSDKPENYDYGTQNHSNTLEKFVIENQLERFTLVVHDFGGPIGLNLAIRYPERIENLVILNSWLWSSKNEDAFVRLEKVLRSRWLPFLYRYLNFSPRFILPMTFGRHKLSKRLLRHYTKPFADRKQRNGTLAFAQSLLNDQDWFEQLWNSRQAISIKPTLFFWGMSDPLIPPHYLSRFVSGFENSTVVRLEACGHFPQEEQPHKLADSILTFLESERHLE